MIDSQSRSVRSITSPLLSKWIGLGSLLTREWFCFALSSRALNASVEASITLSCSCDCFVNDGTP